jgi:hypothetical protein
MIKIYFRQHKNELAFEKFGKLTEKDSVEYETKIGIALSFFDAAQEDPEALGVAKSILENIRVSYPAEWMPEYYLAVIKARETRTPDIPQKNWKQFSARLQIHQQRLIYRLGFIITNKTS